VFDGSVMLDRGATTFQLIRAIVVMNIWVAPTAMVIAMYGVNILRRPSRTAGLQ